MRGLPYFQSKREAVRRNEVVSRLESLTGCLNLTWSRDLKISLSKWLRTGIKDEYEQIIVLEC